MVSCTTDTGLGCGPAIRKGIRKGREKFAFSLPIHTPPVAFIIIHGMTEVRRKICDLKISKLLLSLKFFVIKR
jgi:hypothetical protein